MKRKAILIGSPNGDPSSPFLSGVIEDLKNIKMFLQSSNGGNWKEGTEIVVLPLNPIYADLNFQLNSLRNCDFGLIYYSGHGFTDRNGIPRINLNLSEHIAVSELENCCAKQITIIDSCRTYSKYNVTEGSISGFGEIIFNNANPEKSRLIFNDHVLKSPPGRVTLYAIQEGYSAEDTPKGGYFSTTLLQSTRDVAFRSVKPIISIQEVFNKAFESARDSHKPELRFTNNNAVKLPFVISDKCIIDTKISEKYSPQHSKSNSGWLKLGLGAVAFFSVRAIYKNYISNQK